MSSNQTLSKIESADSLLLAIKEMRDNMIDVAVRVATTLDARPETKNELIEKGCNPFLIANLLSFGRGLLSPRLLFASGRAERKLINMSLPVAEQEIILDEGVEVLEPDGESVRKIPLASLSTRQVSQVFAADKIRTQTEQRTWQQEHPLNATPKTPKTFVVKKDHVLILVAPFELTKSAMLQFLSEIS